MDLAFASCRELPEPDPDQALLSQALAAAGLDAVLWAWDDPSAPFAAAPITLLRSTWNYIHHYDAFIDWASRLGGRLVNPASVVRWNTHKRYLRELDEAGLPTVPTLLIPKGTGVSLAKILHKQHWFRAVAKPAIGAGSFATRVVASGDDAWFAEALGERDMLVQPYMPAVETSGERSLIFIEGQLTHAVRKSVRLSGAAEQVSQECIEVEPDEKALAEAVMRWIVQRLPSGDLLYARIDLVRGDDGMPRIMEVELTEPSLFFTQFPAALSPFVEGIKRRLSFVRR